MNNLEPMKYPLLAELLHNRGLKLLAMYTNKDVAAVFGFEFQERDTTVFQSKSFSFIFIHLWRKEVRKATSYPVIAPHNFSGCHRYSLPRRLFMSHSGYLYCAIGFPTA